jgi:hypothetical protein
MILVVAHKKLLLLYHEIYPTNFSLTHTVSSILRNSFLWFIAQQQLVSSLSLSHLLSRSMTI